MYIQSLAFSIYLLTIYLVDFKPYNCSILVIVDNNIIKIKDIYNKSFISMFKISAISYKTSNDIFLTTLGASIWVKYE